MMEFISKIVENIDGKGENTSIFSLYDNVLDALHTRVVKTQQNFEEIHKGSFPEKCY